MSGIKNLIKDKYPGHLLGSLEYILAKIIASDENVKQKKNQHYWSDLWLNPKINIRKVKKQ